MPKRIVDAVIYLDGLQLDEDESIIDVVNLIKVNFKLGYEIQWSVDYEEVVDD